MKLYQVDAFTRTRFAGNPAAVVPLDDWLPDAELQAIAGENNLSETAYYRPSAHEGADFDLRWLTPAVEVRLCGHATLATAHVLFQHEGFAGERLVFDTLSGLLEVTRAGSRYRMDFPLLPLEPTAVPEEAERALGARPLEAWVGKGLVLRFESAEVLRALTPDMHGVAALDEYAVLATAPGETRGDAAGARPEDRTAVDFTSRFFAPNVGVPEDPVTGSAHCALAPMWAERLGRRELVARQLSARGGEVHCEVQPERERVCISGEAVTYLVGEVQR